MAILALYLGSPLFVSATEDNLSEQRWEQVVRLSQEPCQLRQAILAGLSHEIKDGTTLKLAAIILGTLPEDERIRILQSPDSGENKLACILSHVPSHGQGNLIAQLTNLQL